MTALANNVIQFPKRATDRNQGPQTLDDVTSQVEVVKQAHIQETIEAVIPILFNNLSIMGFQPDEDLDHLKDGALIVEAVRSFLSKTYDVHHPLQLIAQHLFVQTDEDGQLEVADKIKVIITPSDGTSNES